MGSEKLISRCCSSRKLLVSLVDGAWMTTLLLFQGTTLNAYIIRHYSTSITPYFLFFADLLVLATFLGTLATSYTQLRRVAAHEDDVVLTRPPPQRPDTFMSRLGHMPMSYVSWLFYVIVLVTKIVVIFESELVLTLKATQHFGPQLLQVSMAASGLIFLLLVEGHNWVPRGTPRYSYITTICAKTGIEIFDSVSFLAILMAEGPKGLPEWLKDVILAIAAANFFLPAFKLYQLGFPDKILDERTTCVNVAAYLFHTTVVDVPFLAVRLYLWFAYREPASMFLMKNILSIVLTLRGMYPELVEFSRDYLPPSSVNRRYGLKDRQKNKAGMESGKFEEITLKDRDKGDAV